MCDRICPPPPPALSNTNAHEFHKDVEGDAGGRLPEVPRGEEREVCAGRGGGGDQPRRRNLRLECDAAVYIYSSGLLNEVTQVV